MIRIKDAVAVLLLATLFLPVVAVHANVPTVLSITRRIDSGNTLIDVKINHSDPTTNHYISQIALDLDGTTKTFTDLARVTTTEAIYTLNIGATSPNTIKAQATCNLHGPSGWFTEAGGTTVGTTSSGGARLPLRGNNRGHIDCSRRASPRENAIAPTFYPMGTLTNAMTATRITPRYLVTYIAVFAVVVWIFNIVPSEGVEALTAQTSAWALNLFGHAATWEQSAGYTTLALVGQNNVAVSIVRECTALNVLGVMAGLILPLRTSWVRRAKGVAIAGMLLFILNIPRIALTIYLTAYDTWPFTFIANRSLDTYHYPISFAFGVIGVAVTVLAVTRWATPQLSETLLSIFDGITGSGKKANARTLVDDPE